MKIISPGEFASNGGAERFEILSQTLRNIMGIGHRSITYHCQAKEADGRSHGVDTTYGRSTVEDQMA